MRPASFSCLVYRAGELSYNKEEAILKRKGEAYENV